MNKLMKGLGTLVLALSAGCASQPQAVEAPKVPQKVEVTADYLTLGDAARVNAKQDNIYSAQEVSDVIFQYQTLKLSDPKKGDAELKRHYAASVAECEKIINEAFDNADIYAYIGIVTDKGNGNAAKNYGGDLPLYVGKGKDVAKYKKIVNGKEVEINFDIRQKIEFLLKATPKWQSPAENGKVSRERIYATSVGADRDTFAAILKQRQAFGVKNDPNAHYVDAAKWASLTDKNIETNCEIRDDHLYFSAVYNGHPVEQKPAK